MSRGFLVVAAIAAGLGVIAAAQGCAVMSSGQCIDKASCISDDGAGDGATTDGAGPPDVATGDDKTIDVEAGFVDRSVVDMGIADTAADTPIDVPTVGTGDGGDGCVSIGTEDCANGVDDNCDGKIDCEDPLCQPAYTCIPVVPTGWLGPIEFWQAASPATAPPCQPGYGSPIDLHGGTFNAMPASCSCTCTPAGQTCAPTGNFFSQTSCSGTCATVTAAADGSCTPVPANNCGSEGSFTIAGTPVPSGGTCAASGVQTTKPAVTWTASARACPYTDPTPSGSGGCAGAGARCVRAPDVDGGAYDSTACVYSTADPPPTVCPAGYMRGPATVYATNSDTRDCDQTCSCTGTPTGGTCAGTVNLYGNFPDAGCTGNADTYTLATACQCYGQSQCGANDQVVLGNVPGFVRASYTVTAGACAQPTQPMPTGTAAPNGPYTVCCN